jgi:isopenicillin N synthase-like dioxygenase
MQVPGNYTLGPTCKSDQWLHPLTLLNPCQVRQECESTGFLAITGHGISDQQLQQLFDTASQLFDLPYDTKCQLTVRDMQAGRGYEISPEHKAYMQVSAGER